MTELTDLATAAMTWYHALSDLALAEEHGPAPDEWDAYVEAEDRLRRACAIVDWEHGETASGA